MLKSSQKLCSIILAVVLLCSTVPVAFAAGSSHDLSDGALTLTARDGDIRVYGSYDDYGAGIIVKQGYKGTITLDNVSINPQVPPLVQNPAFKEGFLTLKNPYDRSGIYIEEQGDSNAALILDSSGRPTPIASNVIINVVGENKIHAHSQGIYSHISGNQFLLLTGTGTLEVGNDNTEFGINANSLIIDAKTIAKGKTAITASNLTIDKETTAYGMEYGINVGDFLTINAKTTAYGKDFVDPTYGKSHISNYGAGIMGGQIFINAPTYAKGEIGIFAMWVGVYSGQLTVKADTTAIGTKLYGVYSDTNITANNATLKANGNKQGVQIGKGWKNNLIGNGQIVSKAGK